MTHFHVLIPARLESARLQEKPLADLAGQPLVVRVLSRARDSGAVDVHVATDSQRVAAAVKAAGGGVVMTGSGHESGTARLAEAAGLLGLGPAEIVVNLQGDEPLMPPQCLGQVAELLGRNPEAAMATLWTPLDSPEQWLDPNVVKLIGDRQGRALYFSRAPVPRPRDGRWPADLARRHVGLYAYRVEALRTWKRLPPSPLESLEGLEQLRALEAGWKIVCARAAAPVPPGVDTPQDLEAMRAQFEGRTESGNREPEAGNRKRESGNREPETGES